MAIVQATNRSSWRNFTPRIKEAVATVQTVEVNAAKGFPKGWGNFKPQYPKNDKNVSRGRTPEMAGGRPCRFCGSHKHWDKDCEHAKEGYRQAKTQTASFNAAAMRAEAEYEEAYESRFDSDLDEIDTDQHGDNGEIELSHSDDTLHTSDPPEDF
jgi:hypothetical protein